MTVRGGPESSQEDSDDMSEKAPTPTEINYHQRSRVFEIAFDSGERFEMSAE